MSGKNCTPSKWEKVSPSRSAHAGGAIGSVSPQRIIVGCVMGTELDEEGHVANHTRSQASRAARAHGEFLAPTSHSATPTHLHPRPLRAPRLHVSQAHQTSDQCSYLSPLSLESEMPPPFCSSRRPVSHVPQASFLSGTPLSFAAVGTQGEQFVGRAERAVTILQRTNLVTNLLACEDSMAVLAAQQQVLAPISRLTIWTKRRE